MRADVTDTCAGSAADRTDGRSWGVSPFSLAARSPASASYSSGLSQERRRSAETLCYTGRIASHIRREPPRGTPGSAGLARTSSEECRSGGALCGNCSVTTLTPSPAPNRRICQMGSCPDTFHFNLSSYQRFPNFYVSACMRACLHMCVFARVLTYST